MDRPGELHLLLAEVLIGIVGQQLRENEQRVERRAQLVRHVGEKLALVLRRQRELVRFVFDLPLGHLHFAVLLLDFFVLRREQGRFLFELLVRLLQFLLLGLQ